MLSGIRSGQLIVQHRHAAPHGDVPRWAGGVRHLHRALRAAGRGAGAAGAASPPSSSRGALPQVTPTRRIGQVLTPRACVSEANLYNAMTYLVREVVLNLFEMTEGSFLFLEAQAPLSDVVKLPERTRDLVLQGIKRGEATTRLRRQLPGRRARAAGPRGLPPGEESLAHKSGPGITLSELRGAYEGSLHAFLTWVEERIRGRLARHEARGASHARAPQADPGGMARSEAARPRGALQPAARRWCTAPSRRRAGTRACSSGFLESPPPGLEEAYAGRDARRGRARGRGAASAATWPAAARPCRARSRWRRSTRSSPTRSSPPRTCCRRSWPSSCPVTYRALQEGLT